VASEEEEEPGANVKKKKVEREPKKSRVVPSGPLRAGSTKGRRGKSLSGEELRRRSVKIKSV